MILIIGGAYQGKLDFAKRTFALTDADVYTCTGPDLDFSKPCIDHLEAFTFARPDALSVFQTQPDAWQERILICQDLFCGVVPMGADLRAWRQTTGRLCQYLAGEATAVYRLFCGLEQRLK